MKKIYGALGIFVFLFQVSFGKDKLSFADWMKENYRDLDIGALSIPAQQEELKKYLSEYHSYLKGPFYEYLEAIENQNNVQISRDATNEEFQKIYNYWKELKEEEVQIKRTERNVTFIQCLKQAGLGWWSLGTDRKVYQTEYIEAKYKEGYSFEEIEKIHECNIAGAVLNIIPAGILAKGGKAITTLAHTQALSRNWITTAKVGNVLLKDVNLSLKIFKVQKPTQVATKAASEVPKVLKLVDETGKVVKEIVAQPTETIIGSLTTLGKNGEIIASATFKVGEATQAIKKYGLVMNVSKYIFNTAQGMLIGALAVGPIGGEYINPALGPHVKKTINFGLESIDGAFQFYTKGTISEKGEVGTSEGWMAEYRNLLEKNGMKRGLNDLMRGLTQDQVMGMFQIDSLNNFSNSTMIRKDFHSYCRNQKLIKQEVNSPMHLYMLCEKLKWERLDLWVHKYLLDKNLAKVDSTEVLKSYQETLGDFSNKELTASEIDMASGKLVAERKVIQEVLTLMAMRVVHFFMASDSINEHIEKDFEGILEFSRTINPKTGEWEQINVTYLGIKGSYKFSKYDQY